MEKSMPFALHHFLMASRHLFTIFACIPQCCHDVAGRGTTGKGSFRFLIVLLTDGIGVRCDSPRS